MVPGDEPRRTGASTSRESHSAIGRGPRKRSRPAGDRTVHRSSGGDRQSPGKRTLDPSLYINRELSWLEFNQRVLDEARDPRHPLLERVKFLSIVSTNLDEFFMIRVAAIKEQILADIAEYSPDGRTPLGQMKAIHDRVEAMVQEMSTCFWEHLHPQLAAEGIHLMKLGELAQEERQALADYFAREIFPVLTPLAFDPGHPFPYISNLSLSLAVVVRTPKGEERFARVKVPDVLPRLIPLPGGPFDPQNVRFVWLEDLIMNNLGMLFPGMEISEAHPFRVTRNADIEIQEDEAEDLIRSIEESIRMRRFGSVVRVAVEKAMPQRIRDIIIENLEVRPEEVYTITPPMGIGHLTTLLKIPRPDLKDAPHHPATMAMDEEMEDLFGLIRRGDLVLHHPYDSFTPVVQFLKAAARDPAVLAIKQTLYRIGKESPLIPLFIEAAENGKQVAVLVELKARFDEENNIIWAKQLERAGVHVVYGLVGLKTHAKIALVVRKEGEGLRRYIHLGTGNYNPVTARIYTDLSLFTCREEIANDVTEVFNFLTGYSKRENYSKLAVAPINLRERMTALIDREIAHAREGRQAQLVFKMNSLTDTDIMQKLYEASCAGVKVDLIVRGVCCLRPEVPGVSENIRVLSIVGRFLEHTRVYYCLNGGASELYLSSADLMGRNLDRRVELLFPIDSPPLSALIKQEVLDAALCDTARARRLTSDGSYVRLRPAVGEEPLDSQLVPILTRAARAKVPRPVPREAPPPIQP
jgi:polyphosphate kinase